MLPPKDVNPSALWLKLQETPWPSDVMDYPRNGCEARIRIRVLSLEEQDTARFKAFERIKARLDASDLNLSVIQDGVYSDSVAKEVLAICCLEPDPIDPNAERPMYARVFTDGDMVGKLPPDEVRALFTAFEMVQQKFSPGPRDMRSDAELDAWIKLLADGAGYYPLARVPLLQLAELVTSLAARAYGLSATLESRFSDLPDTLKSALAPYNIGTGYFGAPPASGHNSTTPTSPFDAVQDDSIDLADAVDISKRMNRPQ
jgi:hypothetical protein